MRYLLLFFASLSTNCIAQNFVYKSEISQKDLIGIWQGDNDIDGSAWQDVYRFFGNGYLVFNPSQYDGLKRILAIHGHYRVLDNTLHLKVDSTSEVVGGYLVRSRILTKSDGWEIEGGELKVIKHPDIEEEEIELQQERSISSKYRCITIDGRKYFKMSDDPKNY